MPLIQATHTRGGYNMHDRSSLGHMIENLTEAASLLPDGLDTPLYYGVCDGEDLRKLNRVDVGFYAVFDNEFFGLVADPDDAQVVVFRFHDHPGDPTTVVQRGVVSDEQLIKLTDETDD